MLRVGLTGGIATGKTTVAAILRNLGCHMLDADKIAHHLIEPGAAAYEDVVREFGRGILTADGRVDRKKLGAIVFADPARLARLNAIVHPRVLETQDRELEALERGDSYAIAVVEAALLIEAGYAPKLDCLVVRQRIAAQMPIEEKRRMADEVIDCSGSLEHTREQVIALVDKLKRMEAEHRKQPREVDQNDRRKK